MKTPRGIRLNNPGNIRISNTPWKGKIVPSSDAEFEEFTLPYYGMRAMARVLISYMTLRKADTIRLIVARYAPPNENNTESYVKSVAAATGFKPDQKLTPDADTLTHLLRAMIRHENGIQPYTPLAIRLAVLGALGRLQK